MNKAGLQKLVGGTVKLDPTAIAANGKTLDDDWLVTDATGLGLSLKNQRTAATLALGYDSIYSFFLDAARSTAAKPFGILQLHSQITEAIDGTMTVRPLPPPRRGADTFPTDRFRPLVLGDSRTERYFSWQSRDPVHLSAEERPKQLMAFYESLCHALRVESGREPEFDAPSDLRGEPVFELSPDCRARWPLLGGTGGGAGSAMLVLTDKAARFSNGDEILSYGRPCSCGRGDGSFRLSRNEIVQLLLRDELKLYCIMCDQMPKVTDEEKALIKQRL